jgi:hypothetical protein
VIETLVIKVADATLCRFCDKLGISCATKMCSGGTQGRLEGGSREQRHLLGLTAQVVATARPP